MPEIKEDIADEVSTVENNLQVKILIQLISTIFLCLAILTIFLCAGFALWGYFTHHIAQNELTLNIFKYLT